MTGKSAVPNLDQILKSIKGMKTKVTQLTKANETLTSQNENLTSQNQNLTKRIQYGGQVTPIAGQSQVASTTPAPGLKSPGTAQV
jgi:regulator of replication initiation timing